MDFPSKDMRQTTNCQFLALSVYEPHCQDKNIATVESLQLDLRDMRGNDRLTQRETLHHKTERLALYFKQIKFVVFKSNAALFANVCN